MILQSILHLLFFVGVESFSPKSLSELQVAVDDWFVNAATATGLYGQISVWDVSSVVSMDGLFLGKDMVGVDISEWKTPSLRSADYMFGDDSRPSAYISGFCSWDVTRVLDLDKMLSGLGIEGMRFCDPSWMRSDLYLHNMMYENAACGECSGITPYSLGMRYENFQKDDYGEKFVATNANIHSAVANTIAGRSDGTWAHPNHGPISEWDTSAVTDMSYLFQHLTDFSADISGWDTSRVTNMKHMFDETKNFDMHLDWDTSRLVSVDSMFIDSSFSHGLAWNMDTVVNPSDYTLTEIMFGEDGGDYSAFNAWGNDGIKISKTYLIDTFADYFMRKVASNDNDGYNEVMWEPKRILQFHYSSSGMTTAEFYSSFVGGEEKYEKVKISIDKGAYYPSRDCPEGMDANRFDAINWGLQTMQQQQYPSGLSSVGMIDDRLYASGLIDVDTSSISYLYLILESRMACEEAGYETIRVRDECEVALSHVDPTRTLQPNENVRWMPTGCSLFFSKYRYNEHPEGDPASYNNPYKAICKVSSASEEEEDRLTSCERACVNYRGFLLKGDGECFCTHDSYALGLQQAFSDGLFCRSDVYVSKLMSGRESMTDAELTEHFISEYAKECQQMCINPEEGGATFRDDAFWKENTAFSFMVEKVDSNSALCTCLANKWDDCGTDESVFSTKGVISMLQKKSGVRMYKSDPADLAVHYEYFEKICRTCTDCKFSPLKEFEPQDSFPFLVHSYLGRSTQTTHRKCPDGFEWHNPKCVLCPANTYWHRGKCLECPHGTSSLPGSTRCGTILTNDNIHHAVDLHLMPEPLRSDFDTELSFWHAKRRYENPHEYFGDIKHWDTSGVTNMSALFRGRDFNDNIRGWDVSNVEDMTEMFLDSTFSGDLRNWNVVLVKSFDRMFSGSAVTVWHGWVEQDGTAVPNMYHMRTTDCVGDYRHITDVDECKGAHTALGRTGSFTRLTLSSEILSTVCYNSPQEVFPLDEIYVGMKCSSACGHDSYGVSVIKRRQGYSCYCKKCQETSHIPIDPQSFSTVVPAGWCSEFALDSMVNKPTLKECLTHCRGGGDNVAYFKDGQCQCLDYDGYDCNDRWSLASKYTYLTASNEVSVRYVTAAANGDETFDLRLNGYVGSSPQMNGVVSVDKCMYRVKHGEHYVSPATEFVNGDCSADTPCICVKIPSYKYVEHCGGPYKRIDTITECEIAVGNLGYTFSPFLFDSGCISGVGEEVCVLEDVYDVVPCTSGKNVAECRLNGRRCLVGSDVEFGKCFYTDANIHAAVNAWNNNPEGYERLYGHISEWDVSRVVDMTGLFEGMARNPDIRNWDLRQLGSMDRMFKDSHFSYPVDGMALDALGSALDAFKGSLFTHRACGLTFVGAGAKELGGVRGANGLNNCIVDTSIRGAVMSELGTAHIDIRGVVVTVNGFVPSAGAFEIPVGTRITITSTSPVRLSLDDDFSTSFEYTFDSGLTSLYSPSYISNGKDIFIGVLMRNGHREYGDIGDWDVSEVTDMSYLFYGQTVNQSLASWNTANVVSMMGMFEGSTFDEDIRHWDVRNVENFGSMFKDASFAQDLTQWDFVFKHHADIFSGNPNYSGNTLQVSSLQSPVFTSDTLRTAVNMWFDSRDLAISLYKHISKWRVYSVTDMSGLFQNRDFNDDLSRWVVSSVLDMSSLFEGSTFNGDISEWQVMNVENMANMFKKSKFNSPIRYWNVSNVRDMSGMFRDSEFNQYIGDWELRGTVPEKIKVGINQGCESNDNVFVPHPRGSNAAKLFCFDYCNGDFTTETRITNIGDELTTNIGFTMVEKESQPHTCHCHTSACLKETDLSAERRAVRCDPGSENVVDVYSDYDAVQEFHTTEREKLKVVASETCASYYERSYDGRIVRYETNSDKISGINVDEYYYTSAFPNALFYLPNGLYYEQVLTSRWATMGQHFNHMTYSFHSAMELSWNKDSGSDCMYKGKKAKCYWEKRMNGEQQAQIVTSSYQTRYVATIRNDAGYASMCSNSYKVFMHGGWSQSDAGKTCAAESGCKYMERQKNTETYSCGSYSGTCKRYVYKWYRWAAGSCDKKKTRRYYTHRLDERYRTIYRYYPAWDVKIKVDLPPGRYRSSGNGKCGTHGAECACKITYRVQGATTASVPEKRPVVPRNPGFTADARQQACLNACKDYDSVLFSKHGKCSCYTGNFNAYDQTIGTESCVVNNNDKYHVNYIAGRSQDGKTQYGFAQLKDTEVVASENVEFGWLRTGGFGKCLTGPDKGDVIKYTVDDAPGEDLVGQIKPTTFTECKYLCNTTIGCKAFSHGCSGATSDTWHDFKFVSRLFADDEPRLGVCEGVCNSDSDCATNLKCSSSAPCSPSNSYKKCYEPGMCERSTCTLSYTGCEGSEFELDDLSRRYTLRQTYLDAMEYFTTETTGARREWEYSVIVTPVTKFSTRCYTETEVDDALYVTKDECSLVCEGTYAKFTYFESGKCECGDMCENAEDRIWNYELISDDYLENGAVYTYGVPVSNWNTETHKLYRFDNVKTTDMFTGNDAFTQSLCGFGWRYRDLTSLDESQRYVATTCGLCEIGEHMSTCGLCPGVFEFDRCTESRQMFSREYLTAVAGTNGKFMSTNEWTPNGLFWSVPYFQNSARWFQAHTWSKAIWTQPPETPTVVISNERRLYVAIANGVCEDYGYEPLTVDSCAYAAMSVGWTGYSFTTGVSVVETYALGYPGGCTFDGQNIKFNYNVGAPCGSGISGVCLTLNTRNKRVVVPKPTENNAEINAKCIDTNETDSSRLLDFCTAANTFDRYGEGYDFESSGFLLEKDYMVFRRFQQYLQGNISYLDIGVCSDGSVKKREECENVRWIRKCNNRCDNGVCLVDDHVGCVAEWFGDDNFLEYSGYDLWVALNSPEELNYTNTFAKGLHDDFSMSMLEHMTLNNGFEFESRNNSRNITYALSSGLSLNFTLLDAQCSGASGDGFGNVSCVGHVSGVELFLFDESFTAANSTGWVPGYCYGEGTPENYYKKLVINNESGVLSSHVVVGTGLSRDECLSRRVEYCSDTSKTTEGDCTMQWIPYYDSIKDLWLGHENELFNMRPFWETCESDGGVLEINYEVITYGTCESRGMLTVPLRKCADAGKKLFDWNENFDFVGVDTDAGRMQGCVDHPRSRSGYYNFNGADLECSSAYPCACRHKIPQCKKSVAVRTDFTGGASAGRWGGDVFASVTTDNCHGVCTGTEPFTDIEVVFDSNTQPLWSPDNTAFLLKHESGYRMYNLAGHLLNTVGENPHSEYSAFSPDGLYVAQTYYDAEGNRTSIDIHNSSSGELVRSYTQPDVQCGDSNCFWKYSGISWSADGSKLAVGRYRYDSVSGTHIGNVHILNSNSFRILETFDVPSKVMEVLYSPDDVYIAASTDTSVLVWNSYSTALMSTLSPCRNAQWGPDNSITCDSSLWRNIFNQPNQKSLLGSRPTWSWGTHETRIVTVFDESVVLYNKFGTKEDTFRVENAMYASVSKDGKVVLVVTGRLSRHFIKIFRLHDCALYDMTYEHTEKFAGTVYPSGTWSPEAWGEQKFAYIDRSNFITVMGDNTDYHVVSEGTCASNGYSVISNVDECWAANKILYPDYTLPGEISGVNRGGYTRHLDFQLGWVGESLAHGCAKFDNMPWHGNRPDKSGQFNFRPQNIDVPCGSGTYDRTPAPQHFFYYCICTSIRKVSKPDFTPKTVSLSRDGKIASTGNSEVVAWDSQNAVLGSFNMNALAAEWSPDGSTLVAVSDDTVKIWDANAPADAIETFTAGAIKTVKWDPTSARVAILTEDKLVLKRTSKYVTIPSGTCEQNDAEEVTTRAQCEEAANLYGADLHIVYDHGNAIWNTASGPNGLLATLPRCFVVSHCSEGICSKRVTYNDNVVVTKTHEESKKTPTVDRGGLRLICVTVDKEIETVATDMAWGGHTIATINEFNVTIRASAPAFKYEVLPSGTSCAQNGALELAEESDCAAAAVALGVVSNALKLNVVDEYNSPRCYYYSESVHFSRPMNPVELPVSQSYAPICKVLVPMEKTVETGRHRQLNPEGSFIIYDFQLEAHTVSVSPDGNKVAVGGIHPEIGRHNIIRVWDTVGTHVTDARGYTGENIYWKSDNATVLYGPNVWHVDRGLQKIHELYPTKSGQWGGLYVDYSPGMGVSVEWSADGSRFVAFNPVFATGQSAYTARHRGVCRIFDDADSYSKPETYHLGHIVHIINQDDRYGKIISGFVDVRELPELDEIILESQWFSPQYMVVNDGECGGAYTEIFDIDECKRALDFVQLDSVGVGSFNYSTGKDGCLYSVDSALYGINTHGIGTVEGFVELCQLRTTFYSVDKIHSTNGTCDYNGVTIDVSTQEECENYGECSDTAITTQTDCESAGLCTDSSKTTQTECEAAGVCVAYDIQSFSLQVPSESECANYAHCSDGSNKTENECLGGSCTDGVSTTLEDCVRKQYTEDSEYFLKVCNALGEDRESCYVVNGEKRCQNTGLYASGLIDVSSISYLILESPMACEEAGYETIRVRDECEVALSHVDPTRTLQPNENVRWMPTGCSLFFSKYRYNEHPEGDPASYNNPYKAICKKTLHYCEIGALQNRTVSNRYGFGAVECTEDTSLTHEECVLVGGVWALGVCDKCFAPCAGIELGKKVVSRDRECKLCSEVEPVKCAGEVCFVQGDDCMVCPPGKSSQGNKALCTDCPPGTYGLDGVCLTCPVGTVSEIAGATACAVCPENTFSVASKCIPCELGFISPVESIGCQETCYCWEGETVSDCGDSFGNYCESCNDGFVSRFGTCVTECENGVIENGICVCRNMWIHNATRGANCDTCPFPYSEMQDCSDVRCTVVRDLECLGETSNGVLIPVTGNLRWVDGKTVEICSSTRKTDCVCVYGDEAYVPKGAECVDEGERQGIFPVCTATSKLEHCDPRGCHLAEYATGAYCRSGEEVFGGHTWKQTSLNSYCTGVTHAAVSDSLYECGVECVTNNFSGFTFGSVCKCVDLFCARHYRVVAENEVCLKSVSFEQNKNTVRSCASMCFENGAYSFFWDSFTSMCSCMGASVHECSGDFSMERHSSAITYEFTSGVGYDASINIPHENSVGSQDPIYEIVQISTGECTDSDYVVGGACCSVPLPDAKGDNKCYRCDGGNLKHDTHCTEQCVKTNVILDGQTEDVLTIGGRSIHAYSKPPLEEFLHLVSGHSVRQFDEIGSEFVLSDENVQVKAVLVTDGVITFTNQTSGRVYKRIASVGDVDNVKFYKSLMADEYRFARTSVETPTASAIEMFGNIWRNGHCAAYKGHSYNDVVSFDHCLARCNDKWWCVGFSYNEFYQDYTLGWSPWRTLTGDMAKVHRDYYNITGTGDFRSRVQEINPTFSRGVCRLSNTRCEYEGEFTLDGVEKVFDQSVVITEQYMDNARKRSVKRKVPMWKSRGAKRYTLECNHDPSNPDQIDMARACLESDFLPGGQCCQKTQMCSDFGYQCASGSLRDNPLGGSVTDSVFQKTCCAVEAYEFSTTECQLPRCADCQIPDGVVTDADVCEKQFWLVGSLGSMCDDVTSQCAFDPQSTTVPDSWKMVDGHCVYLFGAVEYDLCSVYRYV